MSEISELKWKASGCCAELDFSHPNADETAAHIAYFLLHRMVISCYEEMESQSHQASAGNTATSTPVNGGGFIMMNVANKERMRSPRIDFQLCSIGKYDQPRQQSHMEIQSYFLSVSIAR